MELYLYIVQFWPKQRHWADNLAERSKALASGASPKGRGFKSHSCHKSPCEMSHQFWLCPFVLFLCKWHLIRAHVSRFMLATHGTNES